MPIIYKRSLLKERITENFERTCERSLYREAFEFQENTKFSRDKSADIFAHIGEIRMEAQRVFSMTKHFKEYEGAETIELPSLETIGFKSSFSLDELILKRRSLRDFTGQAIGFNSLARILQLAYSITGGIPYDIGKEQPLRAAPSAGALFPLEIYPVVFRVQGLESGLYHYNVKKSSLEVLKKGNFIKPCREFTNNLDCLDNSAVLVLITAIVERTLAKYRSRGLRFIYLDAGHMVQNMHLTVTEEELMGCALGGIYDYEAERFLDVDGGFETAVYAFIIGR